MRRVLFISHAVEFAGAEIALVRFISLLDRTRFEPLLLVPRIGDLEALIADIPSLRVYYEPTLEMAWDAPNILAQTRAIHAIITTHQPDLVVVNTNTVPQAIIATLLTEIPLLVHLHAFIVNEQFPALPASTRFGDEIWLSLADDVIACSDWVAERYIPLLNRPVVSVPNPTPPLAAAPYPLGETPVIVMLSSLEDNKRPEIFIAAAAGLRRKYPRLAFRCQLYGDGAPGYTAQLHALIAHHRLEGIFTIHARIADTNPVYRSCALVFVPSAFEAFSMVSVEAAAHQRPTIATRSGGPQSIIVDGETGYLIDVDDLDAAIDRLADLLLNPARAAEMGLKAKAHYDALFAPHIIAQQYQNMLDTAIKSAHEQPNRRKWAQSFAHYFTNMVDDGISAP